MAIVKMNKITLIELEKHKEQIIETLMNLGVVEVSAVELNAADEELYGMVASDGNEAVVSDVETSLAKVKSAIDYITKYEGRKKGLFEPKRPVERKKYHDVVLNRHAVWNTVDQIIKLDQLLSALRAEENSLINLIAFLEPWKLLNVPVETASTRNAVILMGTVPAAVDADKLAKELDDTVPESYLELVNSDKDQCYLFVAFHSGREEEFMGILKGKGFSRVTFKDLTGTAGENLEKAGKRIDSIKAERIQIEKGIGSFAKEKESLEILHDYYVMKRDKKEVLNKLLKTDKTFILEGWLPRDESKRVQSEIIKHYDCILDIREPEKDEEHPILLKNHPLVQPFEIITELYSLPSSKGIDPNLFLAPFYFLFFGLMVSDAGYGLLMALITGIILKKFKPKGTSYKLMKLLFLGGISTFLWGALFGGWFGDVVTAVTSGKYSIPPLWFNPLNDPMRLLIWSFIFGGIHIFVGMGLKAYMLIKDGKTLDAIFDVGSWYILLIGLVMLAAGGLTGTIGMYMAIAGTVMLILTQGRSNKNIIKRLLTGILSLYNITGFLSDILSYSRLLALGLATGVIASVINTLGTLFGFGIGGIIIFAFVIVLGTAFNVSINALGAFVHASRLQYVEFYGKFYEAGGKAFKPLKINTKFIDLIDRREN